jgi:outer membrane protein
MKPSGWYRIVCLIGILGIFFPAPWIWPVQGAPAEPLTLSDAINEALANNPEITAARHQLRAADSQVIQARSGLLPQVNVSENYSRTTSPLWVFGNKLNQERIQVEDFDPRRLNDPDALDNFNTALSLSWSLFDGGRTWIGWQQAQQAKEVAALAMRRLEKQIIARTATIYSGLLLAHENRQVVVQSLETARAHLKVVQDRFRNGLAVKSDVLRAQVRIADLEQQLLQADSRAQVAAAMLKAIMGREDGADLLLVTSWQEMEPTAEELERWIAQALENRLDLKQLQVQEQIARKGVDRARAGHWPSLALQGSYDLNSEDAFGDSGESYTVGAVLQVNLYSGQRISAQAAEAKALLAKTQAMQKALALGVRVETQRSYFQAQSAWQSIHVARTAVEQAREGLRIVTNRYENGLLTIVDLLDAQVALQQAQTQHFKALYDYQVARAELALAVGIIDESFR